MNMKGNMKEIFLTTVPGSLTNQSERKIATPEGPLEKPRAGSTLGVDSCL